MNKFDLKDRRRQRRQNHFDKDLKLPKQQRQKPKRNWDGERSETLDEIDL